MADFTSTHRTTAKAPAAKPAAAGGILMCKTDKLAAIAQRLNARHSPAPVQRAANRTGLPNQLKAGVEALSGIAMDDVRVHRNSSRPAQLQAHAFAQGADIHLAPGQEHHLPHEAWHVVQQKQGRVKPTLQMKGTAINDDAGLEHEADVMGAKAMRATPAQRAPAPRRVVAAPTQRVAQLGKPKLIRRRNAKSKNGTFSGVSFKNFRRPSSNSRKQGQHGTAYVSFQHMISARVIDKTPEQAVKSLLSLIPQIRGLISKKTTKTYLLTGLLNAENLLNNAQISLTNKDESTALGEMEDAIGTILTVRNQIPGTATVTTNTGGHGEGHSAGSLVAIEKCLRDQKDFPPEWGTRAAIAKQAAILMWRLIDINPIKNKGNKVIAAKLIEHSKQMLQSYPKTYSFLGEKQAWYLRSRLTLQDNGMPLKGFDKEDINAIKKKMAKANW